MGVATSILVQSKYFLPVFNMAIFDGPFRLYFSQSQEAEALRMYFELHELLGERVRPTRSGAKNNKALFVMLYPDDATFENVFGVNDTLAESRVGDNILVGIKGPLWEPQALEYVMKRVESVFDEAQAVPERLHELSY